MNINIPYLDELKQNKNFCYLYNTFFDTDIMQESDETLNSHILHYIDTAARSDLANKNFSEDFIVAYITYVFYVFVFFEKFIDKFEETFGGTTLQNELVILRKQSLINASNPNGMKSVDMLFSKKPNPYNPNLFINVSSLDEKYPDIVLRFFPVSPDVFLYKVPLEEQEVRCLVTNKVGLRQGSFDIKLNKVSRLELQKLLRAV